MESVMISIKPKWCDLIIRGQKTIEVRKTKPRCGVPFKCYIYCTNDRKIMLERSNYDKSIYLNVNIYYPHKMNCCSLNGKVIGEFMCNCIEPLNNLFVGEPDYHLPYFGECCLSVSELEDYGKGKRLYGWYIYDLKIYDEPKELSKFYHDCGEEPNCKGCPCYYYSSTENGTEEYCCSVLEGFKPLRRPPQSWCYVETGKTKDID